MHTFGVNMTLLSLRETFPARASEWALGLMHFLWFVVLSANETLFDDRVSYRALADVMPQNWWALACLIAGGARLVVLAINGAWRRSPHMRALFAFFSCFFWFEISVGLAQAGTWGTGLAVYPVLFLLDAFNAIRTMGEAGRWDAHHQRTARNGIDT